MKGFLITGNTKSRAKILWKFNIVDILILIVDVILLAIGLVVFEKMKVATVGSVLVLIVVCLIVAILVIPINDDLRVYNFFVKFFRYLFRKKKLEAETITVYINKDGIVRNNHGVYSSVLEIYGKNMFIMSEEKQMLCFQTLDRVIRTIQTGKFIKWNKLQNFDDRILASYRQGKESKEESRKKGNELDLKIFNAYNENLIYTNNYAIIIYANSLEELNDKVNYTLSNMAGRQLNENEVKAFYSDFYLDFEDKNKKNIKETKPDENKEKVEVKVEPQPEIKPDADGFVPYVIKFPQIIEKSKKITIQYGKSDEEIDRKVEYTFISIYSMPLLVGGCFLSTLFQSHDVYVNINFNTNNDIARINKRVNKQINTIYTEEGKIKNETERIKMSEKVEVLQELLKSLNSGLGSTSLLNVDITLMIPNEDKNLIKQVKNTIKLGMSSMPLENKFEQLDSFIAMLPQNITKFENSQVDMTSETLGGCFPFHSSSFYEKTGDILGNSENGDLFAFDMFYNLNSRDTQNRTNSNMVVIGKSGAGKSYFSKLLLKNQLLKNTKVIILDPENEYEYICKKFGGMTLDVSKTDTIKINPFEFVYLANDDEGSNALSSHLEFLNSFFRITLPELSGLAREELNDLLILTYKNKKITNGSDFSKLKSKDFPTFDDLIDTISKEVKRKDLRDNELDALTEIKVSIRKFAKDGVYGSIWNCYSSFNITNDFTTFNFRGLDNATIIKNATMLLITNMINKVLVENANLKGKRKLIFMVDEAHTFIDPNFPVALDLMKQMSKRIRKYYGGLITTTQNIQDFVGFDTNTRTKATAVLNNAQYTCLFGLKQNDLEEVVKMYSQGNSGFTNEEKNYLLTANRGNALMIIDSDSRVPFHASVKDDSEVEYFLPPYQKNN